MGYELEMRVRQPRARHDLDRRCFELERRWQQACDRLQVAVAEYAALRGVAQPGSPQRVAAELRLAEARRRRHEIAEEIERLDLDFDADA
jgi:hypothetical protein